MKAFHGDPAIKAKYLRRLRTHAAADAIVKGQYWENGKGCAVGCTIHSSSHAAYETELGIPQALARLEDMIFEGLPNLKARLWPAEFLKAFKPGRDYSRVQWQFLHWNVVENLGDYGNAQVRAALDQVAAVLVAPMNGLPIDVSAARSAAWSASSAAASAARSTAWSAESAESAAWSAARSAESAAWSAESAARSAARSAESAAARSASAAWSAAWSAAYMKMSRKLLELIVAVQS